jgi:hypothetical protein
MKGVENEWLYIEKAGIWFGYEREAQVFDKTIKEYYNLAVIRPEIMPAKNALKIVEQVEGTK